MIRAILPALLLLLGGCSQDPEPDAVAGFVGAWTLASGGTTMDCGRQPPSNPTFVSIAAIETPGRVESTMELVYKSSQCRFTWAVDDDTATLLGVPGCPSGGSGAEYATIETGTLVRSGDWIDWTTEGTVSVGTIPPDPSMTESCPRREQLRFHRMN